MSTSNSTPNNSSDQPATRICKKCGKSKSLTAEYFVSHSLCKYGLTHTCLECEALYNQNYRQTHVYEPINDPSKTKSCSICGWEKPTTDDYFNVNKYHKDGLCSECKECAADKTKQWAIENPDKVKAQYEREIQKPLYKARRNKNVRTYYATDKGKAKRREHEAKRRARKKNLPINFDDKVDWLRCLEYFDYRCAYCGRMQGLWHILSKEHFIAENNGGGYTIDNIIPACHDLEGGSGGCNNTKSDTPAEQWLVSKFGATKATEILESIRIYFEWAIAQKESSNV